MKRTAFACAALVGLTGIVPTLHAQPAPPKTARPATGTPTGDAKPTGKTSAIDIAPTAGGPGTEVLVTFAGAGPCKPVVDWGEGQGTTAAGVALPQPIVFRHAYPAAGQYKVKAVGCSLELVRDVVITATAAPAATGGPADTRPANQKPDLTILSAGVHPWAANPKTVWYAAVKNVGGADAPACELKLEARIARSDGAVEVVIRTTNVDAMKPGVRRNYGFDLWKELAPTGRVLSAKFTIDSKSEIAESNEANNTIEAGASAVLVTD